MYQTPWYVWALALTGVIGIPVAAAAGLQRGAVAAGVRAWPIGLLTGAIAGAWLAASAAMALFGIYQQTQAHAAPWFGLAFAAGLSGALLLARLPAARRALDTPGMTSRLVLPHAIRVADVVFLIVMAQGHLPAVFALPAGLGDIAVGLSAPFIAWRLAKDPADRAGLRFNVLGLTDLVIALAIGFLAGLSPIQLFSEAPSTITLSQLPLALIPTVAVPTAMALHVTSILRIRAQRRQAAHADGSSARPVSAGTTPRGHHGRPGQAWQ
jgi:hypothetical protein